MRDDQKHEACYVVIDDAAQVQRRVKSRRFRPTEEIVDPWSYQAKRGEGSIRLTLVEYRILRFLAARPNQAITGRRLADAVSTASHRVTEASLGRHIHALRGQLGFFSDYIQSVPYIGYRFKA
jgi:DNA-binding response OmpR family regulator